MALPSPVGLLLAWLKQLVSLWRDDLALEIVGPITSSGPIDTLLVFNAGSMAGILRFAVASMSRKPIEVVRISIDYAAPLQLFDLEDLGFFRREQGWNKERPFRLAWEGKVNIGAQVMQVFALKAQFPDRQERNVTITVHARREHRQFGFLSHGRLRETAVTHTVRLVDEPLLGIMVPTDWAYMSPQAFVTEHSTVLTAPASFQGSVLVHQTLQNGRVSTKRHDFPGT